MITQEVLLKAVGAIMAMPFFPTGEPLVQAAVAEMLSKMVSGDEELEWLIRRVTALFNAWPGTSEIRAVYCSRYKPKDGIEVFSGMYPEGIPSERPAPSLPPLPPGRLLSADAKLDTAIRNPAEVKTITRRKK
jgi:hypothetical protein